MPNFLQKMNSHEMDGLPEVMGAARTCDNLRGPALPRGEIDTNIVALTELEEATKNQVHSVRIPESGSGHHFSVILFSGTTCFSPLHSCRKWLLLSPGNILGYVQRDSPREDLDLARFQRSLVFHAQGLLQESKERIERAL